MVGLLEQRSLGSVSLLSPVLLASARRRTAGWRAGHLLPEASSIDRLSAFRELWRLLRLVEHLLGESSERFFG